MISRTRRASVGGVGMLAVRDCVSFPRHSNAADNPCAGRIETTIGYGVPQRGRFLRHFLSTGLNMDEKQGRGDGRMAAFASPQAMW